MSSPSLIASFVVRVLHYTEGDAPAWRVTVRHVQTGRETRFLKLADALAFMEACSADQPPVAASPED